MICDTWQEIVFLPDNGAYQIYDQNGKEVDRMPIQEAKDLYLCEWGLILENDHVVRSTRSKRNNAVFLHEFEIFFEFALLAKKSCINTDTDNFHIEVAIAEKSHASALAHEQPIRKQRGRPRTKTVAYHREPTKYALFVKENMKRVAELYPPKDHMREIAKLWAEEKKKGHNSKQ